MPLVEYQTAGDVAVIRFTNPPVNGLSHAIRSELTEALERAAVDPAVGAIVVAGGGGLFSAGADIREFGTPAMSREPTLLQLIARVESSAKPLVMALSGTCLGGGLELALAAHARLASTDARLGLPEVKLGLIPGAGGTQRLTRLAGVDRALQMIVSGQPVAAEELGGSGLLQRVASGDPVAAAIELAGSPEFRAAPPRRARDIPLDDAELRQKCEAMREQVRHARPRLTAPLRAIDAVEAAARPFEEGLAFERQAFLELLRSDESRALRHAFFAERAAGKVPGISEATPVRPLESAAVIGAGTMGSGIAVCLLNAGIPVWLLETDQGALERGCARIEAIYESQVQKGRITKGERGRRLALLRPTLAWDDLAAADIAIEAVFESLEVKREVFAALDRVLKPGAILASNTSTLDLDLLAGFTRRPADVVGTHFFSPANVMRLLELVRGRETAAEVLATALRLARTLRKVAVVSGVCDGFIGNRMLEAYTRQAAYLIEEGASPQEVDTAIESFGVAMGPFRVGDLVGNDVSWAIRKRRRAEKPDYRFSLLPDRLCEMGRFGQKSGGGWYDYPEPRKPIPSPVVEQVIAAHRRELGVSPRRIDQAEIVDRLVYALVNEGARILEEGIAARASDIDVVYLTGYGFPVSRGGPMFHADLIGLDTVRRRIREFAANPHGDPGFWHTAPLLDRLADAGGTFQHGEPATA